MVYHFPKGHEADLIVVFIFIKHLHSLHCIVGLNSRGQARQISRRFAA